MRRYFYTRKDDSIVHCDRFLILCNALKALDIAVPTACMVLPWFAIGVWLLFFIVGIILGIEEYIETVKEWPDMTITEFCVSRIDNCEDEDEGISFAVGKHSNKKYIKNPMENPKPL